MLVGKETFAILENEQTIRLMAFVAVMAAVALAEIATPRKKRCAGRPQRWFTNLSIIAIDVVLLRLVFPIAAVGMAIRATDQGWGLFNEIALPGFVEIVLAIILLDFVIWFQHVIFHKIPVLWRLHRMHHLDVDIDVTTGLRFHPFEILLSMLIKMGVVIAIGPAAVAVILFEVILNGMAMFNHGNFRLPLGLDRILRAAIVTPDMHRVHHSIEPGEFNRNFGFNLSIWDRMFGTYCAQPQAGHEGMIIGQADWRKPVKLTLPWLIVFPFLRGADYIPDAVVDNDSGNEPGNGK